LSAAPPEKSAGKYQRLVDHQLSWTLTNLRRDGLIENPRWGRWKLTLLPEVEQAGVSPDEPKLLALRAMTYKKYLRTPEWRRTRAAALLRAGNACSLDVTHTDELEVHHRTYDRLGAELPSDLVVLCRSCHRLHHQEYGRPRKQAGMSLSRPAAEDDFERVDDWFVPRPKKSLLRRLLTGMTRRESAT
jgi:5-methylcytosine-specific restriction endonuclease McrA